MIARFAVSLAALSAVALTGCATFDPARDPLVYSARFTAAPEAARDCYAQAMPAAAVTPFGDGWRFTVPHLASGYMLVRPDPAGGSRAEAYGARTFASLVKRCEARLPPRAG